MPNYFKGVDFLVQIEDVAVPGTYLDIACTRATSGSFGNEGIDVTTKCTMPWRTMIEGGLQSMTLAADGVYNDGVDIDEIEDAVDGNLIVNMKLISGRGDEYAGAYQIPSYERNGDHTDAELFSATFESAGAIVHTPAP